MADQIRIAYLVSRYPAANHTFILREIVTLRSLGLDIQVIAIRGSERAAEHLTPVERSERGRTFVILPPGWRFLAAQFSTLFRHPLGYARGLILALKLGRANPKACTLHLVYLLEAVAAGNAAERAGISHIHTHFSSTVGLLAQRIFGLTLSITIHGPDEFRDVGAFGMREKVARSLFISAISQYARSQVMLASDPVDWPKVEVCRLGVDPAIFVPGVPGKGDDGHRIVCVARLAPVKAQEILIGACQRLVTAGWKLSLHLVGSGPDEHRLKSIVTSLGMGDCVVFEGAQNQEQVISMYLRSDIFALASFAEGVPVVLMEAMAMEIPCVATWVNGVPELIRSEEEGLLVAPSDEAALASAIERLMRDGDLRRRIGIAGRKKVLQEYDLSVNVSLLADVFRRRCSVRYNAGAVGQPVQTR